MKCGNHFEIGCSRLAKMTFSLPLTGLYFSFSFVDDKNRFKNFCRHLINSFFRLVPYIIMIKSKNNVTVLIV